MVMYRYCCAHCNRQFEEMHKIKDRDEPVSFPCVRCGEYEVYRVPGCGGFKLKGFCWSRDNYSRTIGDDPRGSQQKQEDFD